MQPSKLLIKDVNEKDFKTQVLRELTRQGFFAISTFNPARAGVPDVHAVRGVAFWLELKYIGSGHGVSAPQSKFLRNAGEAGAFSGVLIGGYEDGECAFIDHTELGPGPYKDFDRDDTKPLEEMIEWMSKSAEDLLTSREETSDTPLSSEDEEEQKDSS